MDSDWNTEYVIFSKKNFYHKKSENFLTQNSENLG